MRDNRQSRNQIPPVHQEEPDLGHLNRSLELANLELDRVHRQQREFLANTAHELRTPLNAILSFLRLVIDGLCDSPEEARQFVHTAYDSARSLLDLINEHLDSAEIEADKLDLQLTEVNVVAVFDQVEKLARRQADQRKVHLTFRAPRNRVLVRADPIKLSQVLLNLVSNAIQSTVQGEVRVQARSWRDQGHVRFQVRGLGWFPEKQGNLFHEVDPPAPSERRQAEAGAGLAECKTLVECMGGQAWLSTPGRGQGTSAFFTLPLVTPKPLYFRRTADRERGLEVQGPAGGPLILLVEDEPKILDKLGRILQKHGYRTAYAVTADDGLEGAQRLQPDLITIDLGLPVRPLGVLQSGMDLYRALQSDPHLAAIPAILVTGHDPALTQTTRTLPPVLTKPFRAQQLLDLLADQLQGVNLLRSQG